MRSILNVCYLLLVFTRKNFFLKLNFLQKFRILHYSKKKNPEMKWAFLKFEKPHCHLIETKNIIRIRTKIEYFN